MREDMHKVIVERPRRGHSNPSAKTRLKIHDYDPNKEYDYPARISSARRRLYGHDAKEFNDFLSPVRRFLEKRVGMPWNTVYSELIHALDRRKVTGQHVLSHIAKEVETACYIAADGTPYTSTGDYPVSGLYVDPVAGTLLRSTHTKLRECKHALRRVRIDALTEFEQINGIWYLHFSEQLDPDEVVRKEWDPLKRIFITICRKDLPGARRTRRVRTKQASKKELKQLRARLAPHTVSA